MSMIEDRTRLRLTVVGLVIMSMFGVLVARLWFLQVLAGEDFADRSTRNSVRIVTLEAPRGRILDRNGEVLVKNRTALSVGVRRTDFPKDAAKARALKERLGELLGMTVSQIDARLADRRTSPYRPVIVKEDVPDTVIFEISERASEFPGVETMKLAVREYPNGPVASHILGYVGEVNEPELKRSRGTYRLGDPIGRTGLERQYEEFLRGKPGYEKLEVDAAGRVLRQLGYVRPEPGADLVLSIDLQVQTVAEQALAQGVARARGQTFKRTGKRFKAPAGAAVVVDPNNGQIIALASYPTFDLRKFVGGVDDEYFAFLNDPANAYPLYNRAVQAAYPPGSTFKPIVAAAAMQTGAATRTSRFPCKTVFDIAGTPKRNWRARDASISLSQSLVESCDTVYYYLSVDWWRTERQRERNDRPVYEIMPDWSRRFGLGTVAGIDLPGEAKGRVPDRSWKLGVWQANEKEYCRKFERTRERIWEDLCKTGYIWLPGDSANMSIGQGDVTATPLQMAMVYGAIANGGRVLEPRLAMKIVRPDGATVKEIRSRAKSVVRAKPSVFSYIRSALRGVVTAGTARFPYRAWPTASIPVAAKTGSAEIAGKQPFSWFASYGPADRPKYVAVSVVEEAGSGSQVSGPVVRRIMDEIFDLPPLPIVYGEASD